MEILLDIKVPMGMQKATYTTFISQIVQLTQLGRVYLFVMLFRKNGPMGKANADWENSANIALNHLRIIKEMLLGRCFILLFAIKKKQIHNKNFTLDFGIKLTQLMKLNSIEMKKLVNFKETPTYLYFIQNQLTLLAIFN